MTSGIPASELRCIAKNRAGQQCHNAGSPFTDPPLCARHGGYSPTVQAKAAQRAEDYERGFLEPLDPSAVRRRKLAAFYATQERIARRQMAKAGTLADFDRTAVQVRREAEAEQRALVQRLGQEKVEQMRRYAKADREWFVSGGKGDRPRRADFGLDDEQPEQTEQPVEPVEQPEPVQPEPFSRRAPSETPQEFARRARREADEFIARERTAFLQHRVTWERLRRRAELAEDRARQPQRFERLSSGGIVYEDVQAVEATPYETADWR